MNAVKLIIDKSKVKHLYDVNMFADGMGILKSSGYSAIPVIRRDGTYAGTVCDKDFLMQYVENRDKRFYDKLVIKDIIRKGWNPAINIDNDISDILLLSMEQNFVPVVDDKNVFMGIITRKAIIQFLTDRNNLNDKSLYSEAGDARKMELVIHQLEQNVAPYEMFSKMYEIAMKEICIRIETISEVLKFKYNREPLHHVEHRIKSARSVMGKLAKKNLPATVETMRTHLYDIAGVRVICEYIDDVYEFAEYLETQTDLRLIRRKDYIARPKDNGYRSLHLILEVPINYVGATKMIPVEVQLRTEPMDYWASLEHDLKYKPVYNAKDIDISTQLLQCSKELSQTEGKMQDLAKLIGGNDED